MVAPSAIVERYGADAARCYVLFMGPADQDAAWSDTGVKGVHRFLSRLWRLGDELGATTRRPDRRGEQPARSRGRRADARAQGELGDRQGHRRHRRRFAFNTAISAVIELVNELYRNPDADLDARRFATATAASLIFPFAPHLGAEVYERLTGELVWEQPWPAADPAMLQHGHVRARVPGQRQGARPRDGADGRAEGRARELALEVAAASSATSTGTRSRR